RLGAGREPLRLCDRRFPVVGVHEFDEGFRRELRDGEAERSFPGRVQLFEIPVEARDAQHVEGEGEKPFALAEASLRRSRSLLLFRGRSQYAPCHAHADRPLNIEVCLEWIPTSRLSRTRSRSALDVPGSSGPLL